MDYEKLARQLKAHEGYRAEPYRCSRGYWTVGWGHLIHHEHVTPDVATLGALLDQYTDLEQHQAWFESDVNAAVNIAKERAGVHWYGLSDTRQRVLTEMAFVLGNRVFKFRKFWQAVVAGDHHTASNEMRDSLWYQQASNRVAALAEQWAEG